jgi:hypothetical protein
MPKVTTKVGSERSLGVGLWMSMQQVHEATITLDGHDYKIQIHVDYRSEQQRVVVTSVTIKADEHGEVTGTVLRSARFKDLVAESVKNVIIRVEDPIGTITHTNATIFEQAVSHIKKSPDDLANKYLWIARVYRTAEVLGGTPNQDVHRLLGISTRSASEWIKKAKKWVIASGLDWDGSKTEPVELQSMTPEELDAWYAQRFVNAKDKVE